MSSRLRSPAHVAAQGCCFQAGLQGQQVGGLGGAARVAEAAEAGRVHIGPSSQVIEAADIIPELGGGEVVAHQRGLGIQQGVFGGAAPGQRLAGRIGQLQALALRNGVRY